MSSGERPIGAAKGKQSDTEALCQPPPPPGHSSRSPLSRGLAPSPTDMEHPLPLPHAQHPSPSACHAGRTETMECRDVVEGETPHPNNQIALSMLPS